MSILSARPWICFSFPLIVRCLIVWWIRTPQNTCEHSLLQFPTIWVRLIFSMTIANGRLKCVLNRSQVSSTLSILQWFQFETALIIRIFQCRLCYESPKRRPTTLISTRFNSQQTLTSTVSRYECIKSTPYSAANLSCNIWRTAWNYSFFCYFLFKPVIQREERS